MTNSVTFLLLIIEKLLMCQDSLLQISLSFSQIKKVNGKLRKLAKVNISFSLVTAATMSLIVWLVCAKTTH